MRRVLRDHYVGAVLLGLLLYSFFGALIRALQNPILLAIQRMVQHSALSAGQSWYNKGALLAALADALFYLIVAIVLGWWIYRPERTVVETPKS
jgi:hypothetical protein